MAKPILYKRRYDRLHTPFYIRLLSYNYKRLDSDWSLCAQGCNISAGGLSFKYPKVLRRGDHLRILIQGIKGLKEEFFAHIRILWIEDKDAISGRFGARFLKLAPDKKYRLLKLIRNNGGRER